eukprot:symbB.v1.2.025799.t1/scaffold2473.1/size78446/4
MGAVGSLCIPGPKEEDSFGETLIYRTNDAVQVGGRFVQKKPGAVASVMRAPPPARTEPREYVETAVPMSYGQHGDAVAIHTVAETEVPRRPGKFDADRKFRAEIAEMNYKMRNSLGAVPSCRYVSFAEVLKGKTKVAPMCQAPKITFSKWSTADALLNFASRGQIPCGLNFANGEQVGGGYKTGALAQEEDLCRRIPNLYTSLLNAKRDGMYPFGPCTCRTPERPEKYSDVLFTADLVVARAAESQGFELLPRERQAKVSLLTAAAPNVNFAKEVYHLQLMRNTVEATFIAPKLQRRDINTLILGAWGCGAFGGNPHEISELFASVITEWGQLYEEVHFAIPGGRWETNGKVFWETLSKHFDIQEIS